MWAFISGFCAYAISVDILCAGPYRTIITFQAKTNGRAVSEGREISPTRQHKIDELWNSNSSTASKDSAIGKRSNMMTKSSVSRSMDLDDSHMDSPSAKGWLKHAVPHCHRSTLPVVKFLK